MAVETPIVNAPNLYVDNLQLSYSTTTALLMAAGQARNSSNVNDIIVSSAVTINAAVQGVVNGLDQGSLANSTFYAVYAIGDSTQNNAAGGLLSTSFSAPLLPVGYDMYRRVGAVLTDGSAQILKFYQYGSDKTRQMWYDVAISELSGGSSTSFANVDIATSVPPIATNVVMQVLFTPDGATEVAEFLPYGSAASNGIVVFGTGVAGAQQGQVMIPCALNSSAPTIKYKVASGDTLSLSTAGYYDYL